MALAHRGDGTHTPPALREIADRIYSRIDRFAIDLGRDLQEAFEAHPDEYEAWVTGCLPFGLDKASRLRMVHLASLHLPADVLERMPRPWQALYALTRLPANQLTDAVRSGQIHAGMSVRESQAVARQLSGRETKRHSEADLVAGRLVGLRRSALGVEAERLLRSWLD